MNHEEKWRKNGFVLGASAEGVEIWQHPDAGYAKRTIFNAECDVTMAVAADFSTGGERLTKNAAADRYIDLPLFLDAEEGAERLIKKLKSKNAKNLNVAGNGIYTLEKKGWSAEAMDLWMFKCIKMALNEHPLDYLQSGGQTGADTSGAVAACACGVPMRVVLPFGYKQRGEDGKDISRSPDEILEDIKARAQKLIVLSISSKGLGV